MAAIVCWITVTLLWLQESISQIGTMQSSFATYGAAYLYYRQNVVVVCVLYFLVLENVPYNHFSAETGTIDNKHPLPWTCARRCSFLFIPLV